MHSNAFSIELSADDDSKEYGGAQKKNGRPSSLIAIIQPERLFFRTLLTWPISYRVLKNGTTSYKDTFYNLLT